MSSLVGSEGNGIRVFLYRAVDYFAHRPIVPEVNDLHPGGLNDPAHDVNGRIVTIKKGGRGNYTDMIFGLIRACCRRHTNDRNWACKFSEYLDVFRRSG